MRRLARRAPHSSPAFPEPANTEWRAPRSPDCSKRAHWRGPSVPTLRCRFLEAARIGRSSMLRASEKKIAVAQYEKRIQTAFREVADALAARATDAQHIAALEQTIAAQRRRLKLSTLRYQHGIDGYARVLAAQTDLYAARQALIAAHLARWANLVDLYRALGGGWRARRADV